LKLQYDEPLSSFAFNFNLRRYSEVEGIVRAKMEQKDYIILCLEDNSDWNNATTRRYVMECDPELRRTVVVSTKFDTRIPQFSRAADVDMAGACSARRTHSPPPHHSAPAHIGSLLLIVYRIRPPWCV